MTILNIKTNLTETTVTLIPPTSSNPLENNILQRPNLPQPTTQPIIYKKNIKLYKNTYLHKLDNSTFTLYYYCTNET